MSGIVYELDRVTQKQSKVNVKTEWNRIRKAFEGAMIDIATCTIN